MTMTCKKCNEEIEYIQIIETVCYEGSMNENKDVEYDGEIEDPCPTINFYCPECNNLMGSTPEEALTHVKMVEK